jgi:hypothetical protein
MARSSKKANSVSNSVRDQQPGGSRCPQATRAVRTLQVGVVAASRRRAVASFAAPDTGPNTPTHPAASRTAGRRPRRAAPQADAPPGTPAAAARYRRQPDPGASPATPAALRHDTTGTTSHARASAPTDRHDDSPGTDPAAATPGSGCIAYACEPAPSPAPRIRVRIKLARTGVGCPLAACRERGCPLHWSCQGVTGRMRARENHCGVHATVGQSSSRTCIRGRGLLALFGPLRGLRRLQLKQRTLRLEGSSVPPWLFGRMWSMLSLRESLSPHQLQKG